MHQVLVTGPTSGIGQDFARVLASQGHDLILDSRDQSQLDELAGDLSFEFGIQTRSLGADLTQREHTERTAIEIRGEGIDSRTADLSTDRGECT